MLPVAERHDSSGPLPSDVGVKSPMKVLNGRWKSVAELGGSALASISTTAILFAVTGWDSTFAIFVLSLMLFLMIYSVVCFVEHGALEAKSKIATVAIWLLALAGATPLVAIIFYVIANGLPVVAGHFPHFLTNSMVQAADGTAPISKAGVGAAILGTFEQVGLTALLAIPLSVVCAIFFVESKSRYANIIRMVVDAMTGTPSIVAGLFIYEIWVLPRGTSGKMGLAGSLALFVIMLPIVTRTTEEMISIVPGSIKEAALALGAPKWKVMLLVILPTAKAGIVTAAILGIARSVGETAPVLFTAGGSNFYNLNPFHGVQDDLPLRMYQAIFSHGSNADAEAWGTGFVLMSLVLALFVIARFVGAGKQGSPRKIRMLIARTRKSKETANVAPAS